MLKEKNNPEGFKEKRREFTLEFLGEYMKAKKRKLLLTNSK